MPISIKRDVKPAYLLGSRFSLKDTPLFMPIGVGDPIYFRDVLGSYVDAVRPKIADVNWDQFHSNGNFSFPNFSQDIARTLSLKFDLDSSRVDAFNELWTFVRNGQTYEKKKKDDGTIEADLEQAYEITARLAAGERPPERTFSRVDTATEEKIVIFSDFHMTAFGTSVPDYFEDFNYDLYLDVLDYYAGLQYCLVENGDVEDCLLYLPDLNEAKARTNAAPKAVGIGELALPIRQNDSAWDAFMALRYTKRQDSLTKIFDRVRGVLRQGPDAVCCPQHIYQARLCAADRQPRYLHRPEPRAGSQVAGGGQAGHRRLRCALDQEKRADRLRRHARAPIR